jgi:hypothetical protein
MADGHELCYGTCKLGLRIARHLYEYSLSADGVRTGHVPNGSVTLEKAAFDSQIHASSSSDRQSGPDSERETAQQTRRDIQEVDPDERCPD